MAIKSLAIKYRPTTFDDVVEQGSIKIILRQQLENDETKNAYLFCGGAGTGKTTCARIFANEINKFQGNPIEMDAASNSSVDDVREIIQQAKTKSLDSEYKVFIIDECHSLSNTAWQALLKLIEEPPAKSIFIFCTTDPQKIPKTILSRVQRYDFQRISHDGVVNRLITILESENALGTNSLEKPVSEIYRVEQYTLDGVFVRDWDNFNQIATELNYDNVTIEAIRQNCRGKSKSSAGYVWKQVWKYQQFDYDIEAVDYIAKLADGGMRDAITLMDKCLAYNTDLTITNVINALGTVDYSIMIALTKAVVIDKNAGDVISIIEDVHRSGKDLKQFIRTYMNFMLDVNKYGCLHSFDYLEVPVTFEDDVAYIAKHKDECKKLLGTIIKLNADVKWDTAPKSMIEATLLMECEDVK